MGVVVLNDQQFLNIAQSLFVLFQLNQTFGIGQKNAGQRLFVPIGIGKFVVVDSLTMLSQFECQIGIP